MTIDTNTSRSRAQDAEVATPVPRSDADALNVDATVVPVGTFAAGQSADGRHVAVITAPHGSFAEGQTEEDPAGFPEASETSRQAPASRAD